MPYPASYKRQDTPERGRHLVATTYIPKHGLILVERPLCSLQSVGNAHGGALVCRCCRAYSGGPELCLQVASGSILRQHVLEYAKQHASPLIVPCRHACGEIYCTIECEQDFWHNGGHSMLCTGHIQTEQHPLLKFKQHAMQNNEILLLVADVMVRIIRNPACMDSFTDFTMVPWWTVACEPLLKHATGGFVQASQLEASMRTMCEQSASLFAEALGADYPSNNNIITALWFAKFIGSFEQNSMGIRNRHPLCRDIFNVNLRQTFNLNVIQCLVKAGMIAGEGGCEDDECADEECDDSGDQMENEKEDQAPILVEPEQWDYSDDEIAVFLSCLDIQEFNPDGDDLDVLFNPLDGTAMYSIACKMNHSCDPNVVVLYRTRHWGEPLVAHIVAVRDIQAGEELCISYIDAGESLEKRTETLTEYGFVCQCTKCECERAGETMAIEKQAGEEDDMFGQDEDEDNNIDQESNDGMEERDSEALLQRLVELNEKMNENHLGCTPMTLFGKASSFVIRVGALAIDGLETRGDNDMALSLQSCVDAVTDRNLIGCQTLGSTITTTMFDMLQVNGSWPHPAYRSALLASSVAAALGFCHVGSFLEAQRLLDKAMALGLSRLELTGFFDFVEHFANQMARGPIAPALEGQILDYSTEELRNLAMSQGLAAPIEYPVSETACDIDADTFKGNFVDNETSTVIRGFAKDWEGIQKWRDLPRLAYDHGHRIVPLELGSMMKGSGMKETFLTFRTFVANFLLPSSKHEFWSLEDAQERISNIAYLAQHSLLSQIPELSEDVELSPYLCGNEGPSHINIWMGTGGTRTPLHFDSYDNLLVQVVGAKYVRVYSSGEKDKLYCVKSEGGVSSQGNMSEVNCELEDWETHAKASSAKYQEVLLLPGDCLFIPSGAWHYVRSLSTSISVNYWF